jgi:hypothetical protein
METHGRHLVTSWMQRASGRTSVRSSPARPPVAPLAFVSVSPTGALQWCAISGMHLAIRNPQRIGLGRHGSLGAQLISRSPM